MASSCGRAGNCILGTLMAGLAALRPSPWAPINDIVVVIVPDIDLLDDLNTSYYI